MEKIKKVTRKSVPVPLVSGLAIGETTGKPIISYLLLFKVAGHSTWRASMYPDKGAHDKYMEVATKHPEITDKKWFVIDRIAGTITEEKNG